jgi:hypothetical protein
LPRTPAQDSALPYCWSAAFTDIGILSADETGQPFFALGRLLEGHLRGMLGARARRSPPRYAFKRGREGEK